MLLKSLDEKLKFVRFVVIATCITQLLVVGGVLYYNYIQITEERNSIYTTVDGVPLVVKRGMMSYNRDYEYKNTVKMFHNLFFNLPPDDKTIRERVDLSMYLIDESGLKQYNNLKEKGYFNNILSSSANLTLSVDSVVLNGNRFRFYGKQRIERRSSILTRLLITSGYLQDIPRTENNPHGVLIKSWKTEKNKDIEFKEKVNL